MAFPEISDADTTNGVQTSNSTSWTATYPANIAAGDLLLLFIASDGAITHTVTGFTLIVNMSTGCTVTVFAKIAAGTESGSLTLTMSGSEQGAWRIFRIPAASWFGSGIGDLSNDGNGVAHRPKGATSTTVTANPDPFDLDPTNWATEDTLWISGVGIDTSRTISVYPLAGRNTEDNSGGAGGATLGLCTTESAVASLDVGAWTISASDDAGAFTIAVRPAVFVPPAYVPRHPAINHQNPALV